MKRSPLLLRLLGLFSVLIWGLISNAPPSHARSTQGRPTSDMVPVTPPSFNTPDVGYYASWVWPNAGWELIVGAPGDGNSNPAATASGAVVKRTGMYSATGTNIVEAWCDPNYYWIYQGYGTQPFAHEWQLFL